MSIFSKQLIVEYTADQMYDLVSDVNAYSTFIPLCASSRILEVQGNQVRAAFQIAKGLLSFEFTTLNTFEPSRSISMNLEHGPFKHFEGVWNFIPQDGNKSFISLYMEFEFSSALFCFALERLFDQLCDLMLHAFCKQAANVYC